MSFRNLFLLIMGNIPFVKVYHNFFIHLLLMDIWVISSLELLQVKLLCIFMCGHVFSFLLGKHLGVEWLDYVVSGHFNC